jgi:hypothetical protein
MEILPIERMYMGTSIAPHTMVKEILDRYQEEHNICGWLWLVLPTGHWDKLIH